jgi:hypothetical protein
LLDRTVPSTSEIHLFSDALFRASLTRQPSATSHYEYNRPRQFYPDFIVAVREKDGTETMWLAETKGEMRTNVPLKNGAAELWCEKMSATKYGKWRYLFAQQVNLEQALRSGVQTYTDLASRLSA